MFFAYIDESGTSDEPYAIMAAVIVNSQRMGVTKEDWKELLVLLSKIRGKIVKEFHTKEFYAGKGIWSGTDGKMRSAVISAILDWLGTRKHKVSFCAVDKARFLRDRDANEKLRDIGTPWCMLGLHQILSIQKAHAPQGAKGNTIFVFDEKLEEKDRIIQLVTSLPQWTDSYYDKTKKQKQIDMMVDVPYFGDSEKVHLLQTADLIAYILRRHAEIEDAGIKEKYEGEQKKVSAWVEKISELSLPVASRYSKKDRCACAELFFEYAPPSVRAL